MITYKMIIQVRLDKKHIGNIKVYPDNSAQYFPKGAAHYPGEVYLSINACKQSLEAE
jgi:hypothetical protein